MADPNIKITAEDRTGAAFASVERGLSQMAGRAAQFGSALQLGVAALAGAGIVTASKGILDGADAMNKLSQRTGLATEALSELNYAAKLSDVSREELADGLKKLAVKAAEAAGGGKEAGAAFAVLGKEISTLALKGGDTGALLDAIAAKFAGFRDGPEKAALAVEIFGRSGDKLIPLLNQLSTLREEARRLGPVVRGDFAKAAEEFNDNMTRLALVSERAKIALLERLIPALTSAGNKAVEVAAQYGGLVGTLAGIGQAVNIGLFGGAANDLEKQQKLIHATKAELSDLQAKYKAMTTAGGQSPFETMIDKIAGTTPEIIANKIAGAERTLAQFQHRLAVIRDGFDLPVAEPVAPEPSAPVIRKPGAASAPELSDLQRLVKQLTEDYDRLSAAGSKFEEVQAAIRSGALKLKPGETLDGALAIAKRIDDAKASIEALKKEQEAWAQVEKENAEQIAKEWNDLFASVERFKDLGNPTRKLLADVEKIRDLVDRGLLTPSEGTAAEFELQNQIQDILDGTKSKVEETKDAAAELGLVFKSAFEDAAVEGKGLREVVTGLLRDLARLAIRKNIIEPGAAAAGTAGKALLGSIVGAFTGGSAADGAKAQASSLRRALGSTAAPLGGNTTIVSNTTNNIDSRSDAAQIAVMNRLTAEQTKADILASLSRGGQFAQAFAA